MRTLTTTDYIVTGMTCEHCVASIRRELGEVPGIENIDLSLADGALSISSAAPLDDQAVFAAVKEAGYQAERA